MMKMELNDKAIDFMAVGFGGIALIYSLYLGQKEIALAALTGILGYAGGRLSSNSTNQA